MFAPDQERTANELLRVCRSGGRIGLVNWTPDSMMGDVFRATAARVPPPSGIRSPLEWGSEHRLRELFGARVTVAAHEHRTSRMAVPVAATHVAVLPNLVRARPSRPSRRSQTPPTKHAWEKTSLAVYAKHNRSGDETVVAPSDYVEVVAVKA